jgi:hypothetical protein
MYRDRHLGKILIRTNRGGTRREERIPARPGAAGRQAGPPRPAAGTHGGSMCIELMMVTRSPRISAFRSARGVVTRRLFT